MQAELVKANISFDNLQHNLVMPIFDLNLFGSTKIFILSPFSPYAR